MKNQDYKKIFILIGIFSLLSLHLHSQINGSKILNKGTNSDYYFECPIEIHPTADDFPKVDNSFCKDNTGKIIISTRDGDDSYYTPYQTEDRKVLIRAIVPMAKVGETVYFKSVDTDDMSSYEIDPNEDDNYGGTGELDFNSAVVTSYFDTESGVYKGKAEVTLTITSTYSGDNYKVLASFDSSFPENKVAKTVNLVAWKRIYLEHHNMYTRGSFLYTDFNDVPGKDDWIRIYTIGTMQVGDQIIIFDKNGNTVTTTILEIDDQTSFYRIKIENINKSFAEFSGVRKVNDNEIYSLMDSNSQGNYDESIITSGYGCNGFGQDGGVFVEFKDLPPSISEIPNFCFKNNGTAEAFLYLDMIDSWFEAKCNFCNIFMIVSAGNSTLSNSEINLGRSEPSLNSSSVYCANILEVPSMLNFQNYKNEVLSHEIGHQFGVFLIEACSVGFCNHVDNKASLMLNHEGNETCIMTYTNENNNGIVEFDFETDGCIEDIRKQADKQ